MSRCAAWVLGLVLAAGCQSSPLAPDDGTPPPSSTSTTPRSITYIVRGDTGSSGAVSAARLADITYTTPAGSSVSLTKAGLPLSVTLWFTPGATVLLSARAVDGGCLTANLYGDGQYTTPLRSTFACAPNVATVSGTVR